MTNEQINNTVADVISPRLVLGKCEFYKSGEGWVVDCPDYCTDLNAMHEAEETLTVEEWSDYVEHLPSRWEEAIHAAARQRAEAFLKTLGKWEEGE
jgi:hypothetical protein